MTRSDPKSDVVGSTGTFSYLPSIQEATTQNLELQIGNTSELGKMLTDSHFKPTAFIAAEHVTGVWALDL